MMTVKLSPLNAPFSAVWLYVGVTALAISGVFSIILAVAWHPSFKQVEMLATLFHRSLVAHVNLSITVWFLCCLFACWSYKRASTLPYFDKTAQVLITLAIIVMTIASFDPHATPIMSNYIPVLTSHLFSLSLSLIVAATIIKLIDYVATAQRTAHDFFTLGNHLSIIMVVLALAAFTYSAYAIDPFITDEMYYEVIFWGGGHVLQFVWVHVVLLAWAATMQHLQPTFALGAKYKATLWINAFATFTAPIPYLMYDVASPEFRHLFTYLMSWVSGLAPVLFVLCVIYDYVKKRVTIPTYGTAIGASLWWSLILFALGGFFGVAIDGINVKIPAHYHGSIVGVTMALMGFTYLVLQQHGYAFISHSRMARWQPALLGVGQIMHVTGLFWSGGYGVQRKSPHASGAAIEQAEMARHLLSTGGLIAIIGGLLFVIVVIRAVKAKRTH
jgi:cytochrome c oxidase subunit I